MAKRIAINATQFSENWAKGVQGATDKVKAGVNAVNEAPGQKAAAQGDLWLQRVTSSRDKWARNVAAVSLTDWKTATIQKGIPAYTNSVGLAKSKVANFAQELIPAINAALDTMPPRGATLDQNLQRVRHIAQALQTAFA